jgi:hypothetical protein
MHAVYRQTRHARVSWSKLDARHSRRHPQLSLEIGSEGLHVLLLDPSSSFQARSRLMLARQ